jgi:hypothetical protein
MADRKIRVMVTLTIKEAASAGTASRLEEELDPCWAVEELECRLQAACRDAGEEPGACFDLYAEEILD